MLILLPLQGVISFCVHTQGVALGYKILALLGRFINENCIISSSFESGLSARDASAGSFLFIG
jgi:hypothetical protein